VRGVLDLFERKPAGQVRRSIMAVRARFKHPQACRMYRQCLPSHGHSRVSLLHFLHIGSMAPVLDLRTTCPAPKFISTTFGKLHPPSHFTPGQQSNINVIHDCDCLISQLPAHGPFFHQPESHTGACEKDDLVEQSPSLPPTLQLNSPPFV
jgi:hypothetical protein